MAVVSGQPTNWATCITFHYELFINIYKLFISIYRICETTNSCNFLVYSCMFTYFLVYSSMHVQCLCQRTASDVMYFHFDVIINHYIIIHYLELLALQYYVHIYIILLHVCVCVCTCLWQDVKEAFRTFIHFQPYHTMTTPKPCAGSLLHWLWRSHPEGKRPCEMRSGKARQPINLVSLC